MKTARPAGAPRALPTSGGHDCGTLAAMALRGLLIPALLVLGSVAFSSCASFPVNPPLQEIEPESGYRLTLLGEPGPDDETFVILSLSGGGTRAMALDYGVMKELERVEIAPGRSLLDEVDVVTSSSSAALVSAYYAWKGQESFLADFPEVALYPDFQGTLIKKLFAPWNWPRLWSSKYSRSDYADDLLDRAIFHGATFADLARERPVVLLAATDMSRGVQFPFLQGTFDAICSELDGVRLSRAVIASMAFSGGFAPIALRNYSKETCGYQRPEWIDRSLAEPLANARAHDLAVAWSEYEDDSRPWVHLLDSGLADNISVRTLSLAFGVRDEPWSLVDRIESGAVKRLVVVLVDARATGEPRLDRSHKAPGIVSVMSASAGSPMSNFSSDTIELVRQRVEALRVPERYFVYLRFDGLEDEDLRRRLKSVPTSLSLPRETVDLLVDSAPLLLEASPDYRRLVSDLAAGR